MGMKVRLPIYLSLLGNQPAHSWVTLSEENISLRRYVKRRSEGQKYKPILPYCCILISDQYSKRLIVPLLSIPSNKHLILLVRETLRIWS